MTTPYRAREPFSPLKCLFFLQVGIARYDTQATAKIICLLPWISLSGSSKVQPCHKEKPEGNQAWWSSWQTEGPREQGSSPTVPEWGNQRRCGDSTRLRLRVQITRQDHRDKAERSSNGVKPTYQDQSLDQQYPELGMGMIVAQLQGSSAGDKGKRLSLKATLKERNGDP